MRGALLLCCALFAACPKDDGPPPGDDRLLQKLKEEQERLAKGGQAVPGPVPTDNPLARAVVAHAPPKDLTLPTTTTVTHKGTTVTVLSGETTQTVKAGSVELTTGDLFVELQLQVSRDTPGPVDLSKMTLTNGANSWGIAGDVQRSTKSGALSVEVGSEPKNLTAWFEVDRGAVSKGLSLVLPIAQDTVELPLQ